MSITKYNSALGKATNGKIITVFDLKLCDWSSTGFDAKTTSTRFSFLCFIMGKSRRVQVLLVKNEKEHAWAINSRNID